MREDASISGITPAQYLLQMRLLRFRSLFSFGFAHVTRLARSPGHVRGDSLTIFAPSPPPLPPPPRGVCLVRDRERLTLIHVSSLTLSADAKHRMLARMNFALILFVQFDPLLSIESMTSVRFNPGSRIRMTSFMRERSKRTIFVVQMICAK